MSAGMIGAIRLIDGGIESARLTWLDRCTAERVVLIIESSAVTGGDR